MTIRPATTDDAAQVRSVTAQAFGRDLSHLLAALEAGPARLALVAEAGGPVVGHTMLSRGWVDASRALVEVLILSPLSVAPPVQRRGVGGELVRAALAGAASLGAPAVFVEGSPAYYARFGFVPALPLGFTSPSVRIPAPAFQVVTLPAFEPWMIGALVYPEAFWIHDSVGLRG